ncbi:MAG TPA: efflux RND transporter periplasmic adaptor subunit, partial [Pirellulales bacterium]|jgi:cobalt-zinc-cadmium efflux system membrane fusion protein|nr:efflux RND transporter periplasmic adaptor subunit [Pirellulales bacterium]
MTTLRLWDIPQDEIDALHELAKKISAGESEWSKTPEGKWIQGATSAAAHKGENHGAADKNGAATEHNNAVHGESYGAADKNGSGVEHDNPMGRVTLRAPFDGVIIERNLTEDEMVVDNTVNLFQIADVSRLQVLANCHEDMLPTLESHTHSKRRWTVRTAGVEQGTGLPGMIDQIQYVIDQNMHTAIITGYVENPGARLRGGQYVSATVDIPPPDGVVEIPADALNDDGRQSLVLVQPDPEARQFTLRRVRVMQRFEHTVFVRSTPIPEQERLSAEEAEAHLLPKEPLLPGERVLRSGAVELKAAILDLESGHRHEAVAGNKEQTAPGSK